MLGSVLRRTTSIKLLKLLVEKTNILIPGAGSYLTCGERRVLKQRDGRPQPGGLNQFFKGTSGMFFLCIGRNNSHSYESALPWRKEYNPHYAHYKEGFGKTILGFFSDEPENSIILCLVSWQVPWLLSSLRKRENPNEEELGNRNMSFD